MIKDAWYDFTNVHAAYIGYIVRESHSIMLSIVCSGLRRRCSIRWRVPLYDGFERQVW